MAVRETLSSTPLRRGGHEPLHRPDRAAAARRHRRRSTPARRPPDRRRGPSPATRDRPDHRPDRLRPAGRGGLSRGRGPARDPRRASTCPNMALPPATDTPTAATPEPRSRRRNAWAPDAPVTPPGSVRQPADVELGPEWFGLDAFDARGWERLLVPRVARTGRPSRTAPPRPMPGRSATTATRGRALADHLAVRRGVRCRADDRSP